MDKRKFGEYLRKAYLGGLVESCHIEVKDNYLLLRFNAPDKSFLGGVKVKDFSLSDDKFCIYEGLKDAIKGLECLDNNELEFSKDGYFLTLFDGNMKYIISISPEHLVIPGKLKGKNEFDASFDISYNFYRTISKCTKGLDPYRFGLKIEKDIATFYIGNELVGENISIFQYPCDSIKSFNTLYFDFKAFKAFLYNNRNFERSKLEINSRGLLKIQFWHQDFYSVYTQVVCIA